MKRIDTVNSRENMFGVGKSGFHDNADLPGQDATYVSPEWFNTVQEELCNILELNGISPDLNLTNQLADLLITKKNLVNDLTIGGKDKAPTAEIVKLFYNMFSGNGLNRFQIPNTTEPSKPWLIQFGSVNSADYQNTVATFPISFPNSCKSVVGIGLNLSGGINTSVTLNSFSKTIATFNCFVGTANQAQRLAEKDAVIVHYIAHGN